MLSKSSRQRTRLLIVAVVCLVLAASACTSSRETPFISQEDRGTPTPTPLPTPTSPASGAENVEQAPVIIPTLTPLDVAGRDTIKIANWQDKAVALENNLIGYVMVWGYGYTVELADVEPSEYRGAIEKGEIDLVLEVDKNDSDVAAWLDSAVESGIVIDGGTLFTDAQNIRIALHSSMTERAPDLVELLANTTPGDETIAVIAQNVTFGRVGLTPGAAMIKYLKENEDVWKTWMPQEQAAEVKAALDAKKTSLRNRTCIPRGVEANDCGRN